MITFNVLPNGQKKIHFNNELRDFLTGFVYQKISSVSKWNDPKEDGITFLIIKSAQISWN